MVFQRDVRSSRCRAWLGVLLGCAILTAACGDDTPETPPSDPGTSVPPGTEKINGTERLGWDQQASSFEELATFGYLIYVESTASDILGVSCSATPGPSGYACTGRLPPMTAGQHTLSMSAYITVAGTRLESDRSASLLVVLVAASATGVSSSSLDVTTSDGVRLRGAVVAEDLVEPMDLASAPDGRLFIAERSGRIRVFRDGRVQAGRNNTLPDATSKDGQGLLALAVDPQYGQNHFVYVVYTTSTGFRLARLRAVGDTLGDRAILMDAVPSSAFEPAAALRFGPDQKLYVGFDDAGQRERTADLGSFNGKILRLNTDATTPADQPSGSPVFAADVNLPRGLDWNANGTMLWVADGAVGGLLKAQAGPRTSVTRYALPDGTNASALAIYRSDRIKEFHGNLLVATRGGHALLRLVVDAADPAKIIASEQLLGDAVERARAIAVGTDGAIYIATTSALLRLAP
jgi:glucose/arabinose dehydrogenase